MLLISRHDKQEHGKATQEDPGWDQVCPCQDPPFLFSSFPPLLPLPHLVALDPQEAVLSLGYLVCQNQALGLDAC